MLFYEAPDLVSGPVEGLDVFRQVDLVPDWPCHITVGHSRSLSITPFECLTALGSKDVDGQEGIGKEVVPQCLGMGHSGVEWPLPPACQMEQPAQGQHLFFSFV